MMGDILSSFMVIIVDWNVKYHLIKSQYQDDLVWDRSKIPPT